MTSVTHHPARLVDGGFAALNSDDPALTVTGLQVALEDLAEQLDTAIAEISALPAATYSDDERDAYTRDAMAAHPAARRGAQAGCSGALPRLLLSSVAVA